MTRAAHVRIGDPRLPDRFWAKVREDETGCWLWTAGARRGGRGRFEIGTNQAKQAVTAYRYSYMNLVGPIPEGYQIDHLCRRPACVNPAHLEPVTGPENMRRHYATITHCVNGHLFDERNTYICPDGWRSCRECSRIRMARYRLAARQAAERAA